MSTKYPGGIVIANPTLPTSSLAPGVWTLEQMSENVRAGTWPSGTAYFTGDVTGPFNTAGYATTTDSSGNFYVVGTYSTASGLSSEQAFVAKYDSNGTILWSVYLVVTYVAFFQGIKVSSAGNIYIVGYEYKTSVNQNPSATIYKFDSTGAIVWQRQVTSPTPNTLGYCIAIDSSENAYIGGQTFAGSFFPAFIAKYNSSGTIQWQERYGNTGNNTAVAYGMASDESGNIYITGRSSDNNIECTFRFPS